MKRKKIVAELERYYTPSKRSTKAQMRAQLIHWANSINQLHSERLSSVGFDDIGDLCDDVPVFADWMNRLFLMEAAWEGK